MGTAASHLQGGDVSSDMGTIDPRQLANTTSTPSTLHLQQPVHNAAKPSVMSPHQLHKNNSPAMDMSTSPKGRSAPSEVPVAANTPPATPAFDRHLPKTASPLATSSPAMPHTTTNLANPAFSPQQTMPTTFMRQPSTNSQVAIPAFNQQQSSGPRPTAQQYIGMQGPGTFSNEPRYFPPSRTDGSLANMQAPTPTVSRPQMPMMSCIGQPQISSQPAMSFPNPQFSFNQQAPSGFRSFDAQTHNLTHPGPTQHRKPATSEQPHNGIAPNLPRFDPKATLNPRAAFGKQSSSNSHVENARAIDGLNGVSNAQSGDGEDSSGMSSLIERMHNVQKREATSVTKKRKSETKEEEDDDEPDKKKSTSSFHGAVNGGPISEHMKEQREKAAEESGPPAAPIDLTGDDDDGEVQYTMSKKIKKDDENTEVCLGVLQGKANISRIPTYSARATASLGKDMWPKTKLDFKRDANNNHVVELTDRIGRVCGRLDIKFASALVPLIDGRHTNKMRMSVYLDMHRRTSSQFSGQNVSLNLGVSIVLYAPRSKKDTIGRWLSQKGLFLSSPAVAGVPIGIREVDNPHEPKVLGSSGRGGERKPQTSQPVAVARTVEEMRREASSMFDDLVKHENLPEMELSSTIITSPLMSHQKQALHFLTEHERSITNAASDNSNFSLWKFRLNGKGNEVWYNVITGQELPHKPEPVRGGILADMMGLGKTLSTLSLIAETKAEARDFGDMKAPLDLVDIQRNMKATLIICPKSVMSNWEEQIRQHSKDRAFKVYSYHGSNRTDDLTKLASYNIILTTYNTAAADFTMKKRVLSAVNWFRIVLDEAHQIRNQDTQVSKACCALIAERRWALTGTPVQNGLGDLGALIKFLRIKPFDEPRNWAQYIISPFRSGNTDTVQHLRLLVDSITLRRLKDTIDLKGRHEGREILDFNDADRKIYAKISGESRKQLLRLTGGTESALKGKAYAHVLKSIGRMRQFCAHGLDMFSEEDRREIEEGLNPDNAIAIDLGDEPALEGKESFIAEKPAYDWLRTMGESDVDRCAKCNNKISEPEPGVDGAPVQTDDEASSSDDEDEDETIGYLTPCYHLICPNCKDKYIEEIEPSMTADERHLCSLCDSFVRFGLFEYRRSTMDEINEAYALSIKKRKRREIDQTSYNGPSTKVHALLEDLKKSAIETESLPPDEPPIRSVVFSGWTTYLDLIEIALEENGIGYVRLDGSMSVRQRTAVLDRFRTEPDIVVILVSIKAGGQGLNFTAANKVYMMEPQFNPGVEQQAIDRVHRIGQLREVFVTHYIMRDSIEENILKLQAKKEDLAKFTLERKMSKAEESKKRIENLRDLFR